MKGRLGLILAVVVGLAAVAGLAVQDDQNLKQDQYKKARDAYEDLIKNYPSGTSHQNWVAITANVGIALKPMRSPGLGGKPASVEYSGTIMYKPTPNGSWQPLMIDNPVRQMPISDNSVK